MPKIFTAPGSRPAARTAARTAATRGVMTCFDGPDMNTHSAWRAAKSRPGGEKAADTIGSKIGRVEFVVFHLVWFVLWAAFNTRLAPMLPVFDPYPFNLFGTLISLEAVMISALVLIKQNRMSLLDERRAHVELQMTLLSEKEITKLLRIMEHVTSRMGIDDAFDAEARELREHTQVEEVARAVRDTLPE